MILYANGCSHTAAAEAVVPDCFAVDDGRHGIDRRPHPVNLAASWCTHVAHDLDMQLVCEAESGGSNARILRTTQNWIDANPHLLSETVIVLQWTTWERQEWLHQGRWYQVNASGSDWVPEELRHRYKQYIIDIDWDQCTQQVHNEIWQLHQTLKSQKIRHLFFNGHSTFDSIQSQYNWGKHYIDPYNADECYYNWLLNHGGTRATSQSYHFDAKSHRLWATHVLQYINDNQILEPLNEIPVDRHQ